MNLHDAISTCAAMHKPPRRFWFHGRLGWAVLLAVNFPVVAAAAPAEDCKAGSQQSAMANAASLTTLTLNVFGRVETGWAFYEPLIAHEIGTECEATTAGFAHALATWQTTHNLPASGTVTQAMLDSMKLQWQQRRPFVIESKHQCPDPPPEATLAQVFPCLRLVT